MRYKYHMIGLDTNKLNKCSQVIYVMSRDKTAKYLTFPVI